MTEENNENVKEPASLKGSETITIKKDALWKYSTFVLAAVVIVGFFVMISGDKGAPTAAVVAPTAPAPTAPAPSASAKVDLSKLEHIKGDSKAPVTLVEWTDYECPFCGRFYSQTYGQIMSEYVDTGKIKFAVEDFALSFHPNAQKAAEATECAGKQDKFWEMHDLLFEKGVQGGVPTFKGYATELGLNTDDFNECLDSGEFASAVQADQGEGSQAGVRGTPGFAVVAADGTVTPISGAQPFQAFDAALKAAGA